jgi:hypothetical protein
MIKVQLHDYKYCQDLWIDDNPPLFALLSMVEMVVVVELHHSTDAELKVCKRGSTDCPLS